MSRQTLYLAGSMQTAWPSRLTPVQHSEHLRAVRRRSDEPLPKALAGVAHCASDECGGPVVGSDVYQPDPGKPCPRCGGVLA